MGSNQSTDSSGSFSVDPSGNITHKHSSPEKSGWQNQPSPTQSEAELSQATSSHRVTPDPPSPVQIDTSSISTMSRSVGDGMSLNEADEIVTRMKTKYKPKEMAGRNRSVFEEVERDLANCYANNKNQPLNCMNVAEKYEHHVQHQRSQLLSKRSTISSNVPLIATVLAIIACLIVNMTPVAGLGAMSIDLGSEWMKVGLVAPNVQMDIVLNAQSQRKTPMAIAFSNGERFIGDPALDIASKYPEKTFTHFLDLVGKTLDDESVKHYKQRFPHADITSHEPNSTSIVLNHPDGLKFTPLELVAMMIEHAQDQAAIRLNSESEVASDVVITVPPFFNTKERGVIVDAARITGLNVLRLTNVNSAFALSYGIFRHKDYEPKTSSNKTTILFVDQGASHTSASLVDYHLVEQFDEATQVSKNESLPTITVRSEVYDRYLGGFDMQLRLRDHLIDKFSNLNKIDKVRIYKRGRSVSKVLKESGRVKKVLSANADHTVRIENVIDDKDLRYPITREEFEKLNEDLMGYRLTKLLDRLFEMPEVDRYEPIESVIIVGGNTRTPKLQQVLLEYFKISSLGKSVNADEGAALAALYQAASLGRGFRVKKFVLEEYNQAIREQERNSTTYEAEKVYSEVQLDMINKRLAHLREQDHLRLQRLSLINSLESLLRDALSSDGEIQKEGDGEKLDELRKTFNWMEEMSNKDRENITLLVEKYTHIHHIVHPTPPPTPPSTLAPTPPSEEASSTPTTPSSNETVTVAPTQEPTPSESTGEAPPELAPVPPADPPLHTEL